jgi:4-hydroxy-tetrahydrodipicolinate reductase
MRVAVVGMGRMGHEVQSVLLERGHEVAGIDIGQAFPGGCAVGIDFTQPDAVMANIDKALRAGTRYVVGTTGWNTNLDDVRARVEAASGGLVHAPNVSLGVNLFYRVVRHAAELMARFPDYDPYLLERHHRLKKDAPSGTALALKSLVEAAGGQRKRALSEFEGAIPKDAFHVASVRAGGIVGDHTVGFDSGGDEILLEHRARSRRGFALGSVLAAEWIADKKGVHSFEHVVDDILKSSGWGAAKA